MRHPASDWYPDPLFLGRNDWSRPPQPGPIALYCYLRPPAPPPRPPNASAVTAAAQAAGDDCCRKNQKEERAHIVTTRLPEREWPSDCHPRVRVAPVLSVGLHTGRPPGRLRADLHGQCTTRMGRPSVSVQSQPASVVGHLGPVRLSPAWVFELGRTKPAPQNT